MLKIPQNSTVKMADSSAQTEDEFSMPFDLQTAMETEMANAPAKIVVNPSAHLQATTQERFATEANEMLERIARMLLLGFTSTQIAIAASSTAEEIEQLVKTQELQAELDRLITAKTEQAATVADGWDEVEAASLEVIKTKLQNPFGVDEDFALRAATLANKASRGRAQQLRSQAQLPGGSAVDNAVIFLGATFVGNLQNNFNVLTERVQEAPEKKVFNSLSAEDVSTLLDADNANEETTSEIANFFDEGLSLATP